MSQQTVNALREALEVLAPVQLDIQDDSELHRGHAGARDGGGHYRILIVSGHFRGLSTLARHRLVYDSVGSMMHGAIHALVIRALTPEEL